MRDCAEIISIGAEVLMGSVLNTNARFLGKQLSGFGFNVKNQVTCQDDLDEISSKLGQALQRSDLIILTGGLGPTPDDVTRDAVARYFSVPLVFSKKQYQLIRNIYAKRGKRVPVIVKREALFPENAVPLLNRYGIALGFYVWSAGRLVVSLPGVPREMEKIFLDNVVPQIKKKFRHVKKRHKIVVRTVGVSEPTVMARLGKTFFKEGEFDFGIYPDAGEVSIRIQTASAVLARRLLTRCRKNLKANLYADHDSTLAAEVGRLLTKKKQTLAVAESCSGGVLSAALTQVPHASRYFLGGLTAYHNRVKQNGLGIARQDLKKHGAVSAQIAGQMARGVREKMDADFGIGISGIAGPTGGTRSKPVGTVFIALASKGRVRTWEHHFWGDRNQVQVRSAKKALEHLWRALRSRP